MFVSIIIFCSTSKMSPLSKTMISLVLLFCILTTTIEHTHALTFCKIFRCPKHTTVRVTNRLESNEVLTVHCKSKDDDIGEQKLVFDNDFQFKFKTDFGIVDSRTLFFCSFQWGNEFKRFDIFIANRDHCTECFWDVFERGPCLEYNQGQVGYCLPWK
ncbi:putative plant self-incompatibility S1 [Rosa chinensis]|uniref:S-protein homolog n=1 Tax=Rosa chinensis TaxID=74649 RepID=A0A2P6PBH5_ROSCH|nr:putative plant self-incompatibility S1 [Rosa chinensis]